MIVLDFMNFDGGREIECLRDQLEARFRIKVHVFNLEFDSCAFLHSRRNQYNSSAIIDLIEKEFPSNGSKVLAVTGLDLYVPILTFVFGEARLNGRCAVISTCRLNNKFYGLPDNPALLRERLLKEAIHELGHTLGLLHCRNRECVMKTSTYVEEIDLKGNWFCFKCMDKIGFRARQV